MTRLGGAFIILVLGGASLWAQTGRPPDSGRNTRPRTIITIQGRVLPGVRESQLPELMTATLSQFSGGVVQTRLVRSGLFEFKGVPPGRYLVRLECQGFQPVERSLDLRTVRNNRNEFIQINIGPRLESAETVPPPGVTTVDAQTLSIPAKAQKELERAQSASRDGNYERAVRHLKKALQIHAEMPEAYNNLAVQYLRLGRPEEALDSVTRSLAIRPSAEAYQNLGVLQLNQGRYQEAANALFEAHRMDATDGQTIRSLGELYFRVGQYTTALEWFDKVDDDGDAMLALARGHCHLRLENYPESARYFEAFLSLAPKSPQAKETRRLISQIRKNLEER